MYHFGFFIFYLSDNVSEILTFKAHAKGVLLLKSQSFLYIINNLRGSSCSQSEDRSMWNKFTDFCDLQVRWAEIVAPLAYTMGFIHGDEANFHVT